MKTHTLLIVIAILFQGCLLFANTPAPGTTLNKDNPVVIDTLDYTLMAPSEGVQFYKNGVIILSSSKLQHRMIADHVSFGVKGTFFVSSGDVTAYGNDMFVAGDPFPISPEGMSFSPEYDRLYYTTGLGTQKIKKIMSVPLQASGSNQVRLNTSEAEALAFTTGNDNYMHPAISADGSFMVFASDNPKSTGKYDLFVVKKSKGAWGDPVNLGESINTVKDEIYPFLDDENNLYFSSDGHSGFGGMDIYMCRFINDGWGSPVNLMRSINSAFDEVAITIDPENRTGYYSVINIPGKADKQVLKISLNQSGKLCDVLLKQAKDEYKIRFDEDLADAETQATPGVSLASIAETEKESQEGSPSQTVSTPGNTGAAAVAAGTAAAVTTAAISEEKKDEPVRQVVEEKPVEQIPVEEKVETPVEPEPEPVVEELVQEDEVIFRVQITSSSKPKTNYKVTIDGKSYSTFQYFYVGAYRYCVGEFKTVSEANAFKTICRAAGFNQAFVAAFVNGERETDPSVFRR